MTNKNHVSNYSRRPIRKLVGFLSVSLLATGVLMGIQDREATFFHTLFGGCLSEHRRIEFRAINHQTEKVEQRFFASPESFLVAAMKQRPDWDHYFGIHPRDRENGSADAISFVTCLWADVDWKNFPGGKDDAIRQIQEFPISPTVVTDSGHGFHVYWLLKEPEPLEDPEYFRRIVRGVQQAVGSDPVDDLARVLRVPGTLNCKDPTNLVPCRSIFSDYNRRYTVSAFDLFASDDSASQSQPAHPLDEVIPEGARNQTLMSLAGSMRRRGMSSDEIYNAIQGVNTHRCKPPLQNSEVQSIATSAARYQPSDSTFADSRPDNQEAWSEREELPAPTRPVPTLPQDLLPGALKPWLVDTSDRLQVPLEFVAAPAIVALGAVVGRQVGICPKEYDDWFEIPNLWGGNVARPGTLKTASIQEGLRPLGQLVALSRERYRQETEEAQPKLETHNALIKAVQDRMKSTAKKRLVKLEGWAENRGELERLEQELRELEANAKAFEVKEQRYKTNDPTVEKLAVLLAGNPRGLLLCRDELSGWLLSLERSGREGDREFYLESWNGTGSYTVDRIGRGTLDVEALCLSIFGGIQPGKLGRYVREALEGGFADDGLLQRFQLLVYPDPGEWEFVDRRPDQEARERAYRIYARLDRLDADALGVTEESSSGVPFLRFSKDAQELFNTWLVELEGRLRSGEIETPAFESYLAKHRSLMPSLSLLFHLVERADGKVAANGITRESAAQAAAWCDFLEAHALKIYAGAIHPDVESAHALGKRIESGEVRDGDTIKVIYRHGWSLLSSRSDVVGAIGVLEDCHWLRVQKLGDQGRPSEVIRLHPDFKGTDS